jgi:Na+-driven multidrug efflux pump
VLAWGAPIAEALGSPRLGLLGAAWGTLIGRTIPVIIGALLLANRRGGPRFHCLYLRPFWKELRTLFAIGWPQSTQLVVRVAVILAFISLINDNFTTAADQSVLTGYSICLRLETMALFIGMGWGAAASSFVGANLGAGHFARARNSGWMAALYNLACMILLTVLYVAWSEPIVGFFDDDAPVLAVGKEYLRIVGVTYAMLGLALVLSQAMAGAGATLSSLVIDGAVLLLFVVPVAIFVTEPLGMSRTALWYVIAGGNVLAALAYGAYYLTGAFLTKRV